MQQAAINAFMKSQDSTHTGGWMMNVIEKKITLVEETYKLFGIDKEKFDKTFDGILKCIHPDDVPLIQAFMKMLLNTEKPEYYEFEHRVILQDGETRILKEILKTNFDKDGKLNIISGTASDVTERRLYEKALRESEQRYKSIFECSLAMLIIVDNHRKITGFNPEAYKKFGYTPEEIINKDISILYQSPEDELLVHQSLQVDGHFMGKVANVRKNGETFVVQLSAAILYDAEGNKIGTVGSSLEVEESA